MTRGDGRPDEYVLQVRDNTRQYVQELLRENERLREIATALGHFDPFIPAFALMLPGVENLGCDLDSKRLE